MHPIPFSILFIYSLTGAVYTVVLIELLNTLLRPQTGLFWSISLWMVLSFIGLAWLHYLILAHYGFAFQMLLGALILLTAILIYMVRMRL